MIRLELTKSRSPERKYRLRIDEELFTPDNKRVRPRLIIDSSTFESIHIQVGALDLRKKIAEHSFNEIPKEIESIDLLDQACICLDSSLLEPINYMSCQRTTDGSFEISWMMLPDVRNWSAPYFAVELIGEFYRRLRPYYQIRFLDQKEHSFEGDELALDIKVQTSSLESTIAAELLAHEQKIQRIHDETIDFLSSSLDRNSLGVSFNFPESISVACEQYLLYFGQFLQDLGVRAETALTHEAGQVLFTVVPINRKEALDKIQEALKIYLKLPSSPISDSSNESIVVHRLESAVLRLRSDLKLAAAELQAKEATIKAQNLTISILNGDILVNSVREMTPKPEDKEPVIPGIVALSTYKEKGVEINLGEMFRRVKKFFTED